MCRCLAIIILALSLTACEDPEEARRTLDASGFADVTTHGASWNGCGEVDTTGTKFTATNVRGKQVSGVVCCGWLKGCTVRF